MLFLHGLPGFALHPFRQLTECQRLTLRNKDSSTTTFRCTWSGPDEAEYFSNIIIEKLPWFLLMNKGQMSQLWKTKRIKCISTIASRGKSRGFSRYLTERQQYLLAPEFPATCFLMCISMDAFGAGSVDRLENIPPMGTIKQLSPVSISLIHNSGVFTRSQGARISC